MPRAADYTIQGFLYQFNKTLLEVLTARDDAVITVEGIEDVDVATPSTVTAIQCKYHESQERFVPSAIFKPLLQMMQHFRVNPKGRIRYVLFCHFPDHPADKSSAAVDLRKYMSAALNSKDEALRRYTNELCGCVDIDAFAARFSVEFGPSYDALVAQVGLALEEAGMPKGDIETLAYPNAIHTVATLGIRHDPSDRKITKAELLATLHHIKSTAVSRWTLALKTRRQILDARRRQLKANLDKNTRRRCVVIQADTLVDFDSDVVMFVKGYLDKYHFKLAHTSTPLICLRTSEVVFRDLQFRLYQKGVISNDGYVGTQFDRRRFLREPMSQNGLNGRPHREFALRLLRWEPAGEAHGNGKVPSVLNEAKPDDVFILGPGDHDGLDTTDVNVEVLAAPSLKEIAYMMGVSHAYE